MPAMPVDNADSAANHYYTLVQEQQIHKCYDAPGGCCDNEHKVCHRGYMAKEIAARTSFDTKGFPVYRRPTAADFLVTTKFF